MKRKDLKVGMVVAVSRSRDGRYASRAIVMATEPWHAGWGYSTPRPARPYDKQNGVAIAMPFGVGVVSWSPWVVPLSHIKDEWGAWEKKDAERREREDRERREKNAARKAQEEADVAWTETTVSRIENLWPNAGREIVCDGKARELIFRGGEVEKLLNLLEGLDADRVDGLG